MFYQEGLVFRRGFAEQSDKALVRPRFRRVRGDFGGEYFGEGRIQGFCELLQRGKRKILLYALGVCLYEMLAGEAPFEGLDIQGAKERNPKGPETGTARVVRGGSWLFNADNTRSGFRLRLNPEYKNDNIGFRCAVPRQEPE